MRPPAQTAGRHSGIRESRCRDRASPEPSSAVRQNRGYPRNSPFRTHRTRGRPESRGLRLPRYRLASSDSLALLSKSVTHVHGIRQLCKPPPMRCGRPFVYPARQELKCIVLRNRMVHLSTCSGLNSCLISHGYTSESVVCFDMDRAAQGFAQSGQPQIMLVVGRGDHSLETRPVRSPREMPTPRRQEIVRSLGVLGSYVHDLSPMGV